MLTGPRGLFLIAGQEKVVTVDLERVLTAPPVEHLTVHRVRPGPAGADVPVLLFGPEDAHIVLMDRALVERFSPEVSTATPSRLFHVADIEAVHEKMEKGGATVSPLVDMGGMRSFGFSDDEGHWIAAAES